MNERKFSNFLEKLMQSRQLNITSLASKLELKNRNVIMRILNNKATSGTLISFAQQLKEHITLTSEELEALNMSLEHEQIPDSVVAARQTLSYLFRKDIPETKNELLCVLRNYQSCDEKIYMGDDIISILKNDPDDDFEIYIEGINTIPFTHALYSALSERRTGKIDVHQFFSDTDDTHESLLQLYAAIKLSAHLPYYPYIMDTAVYSSKSVCIINNTKNTVHMLKAFDSTRYTRMDNDVAGTGMGEHFLKLFDILKDSSAPLKESFESPIDNLPGFIEKMMKLDNITSYEIKSSPCFMLIPFDIQQKLYEESNYLGLGFDNPNIQKIYSLLVARDKKFYETKPIKHFVYSKEGILDFLETGETSDYLSHLRPLTPEERKATILRIINTDNFLPYFFKEDYHVTSVECALFESTYLCIYDPSNRYWNDFCELGIKNKKMLRIMRDFFIEEILKNCCYSPDETREMLRSMIE